LFIELITEELFFKGNKAFLVFILWNPFVLIVSDDSLYAQSNNGDSTAADEAKENEKKTDILNDVQLQIHYSILWIINLSIYLQSWAKNFAHFVIQTKLKLETLLQSILNK